MNGLLRNSGLAALGALVLCGCSSVQVRGTVVELTGTVNPLRYGQHTCWILETGSMREKAFYELYGSERLLKQLRRDNARVRLRALLHPDRPPTCGIGTPAEVLEILQLEP